MAIYEDLLAIPTEEQAVVEPSEEVAVSSADIVSATLQRLNPELSNTNQGIPIHQALLARLEKLVVEANKGQAAEQMEAVNAEAEHKDVVQVMSEQEWQALIQSSVRKNIA